MKRILVLAAIAVCAAGVASADPIFGTWQTAKDDNGNYGQIEVAACGAKICGTLKRSFNPDGSELDSANNGKKIVWGMQAKGGGAYGGGKVWSPDRDKTYNSKLQLTGDTLAVSGCVLGICRDGGTWSRVN
jgi:uncharacterized protein (DUF2147 family)